VGVLLVVGVYDWVFYVVFSFGEWDYWGVAVGHVGNLAHVRYAVSVDDRCCSSALSLSNRFVRVLELGDWIKFVTFFRFFWPEMA
jgi:hypothetical protein